ncbi:MAG TPA: NAD-dependent dehydratase [Clostridiales bacterium]|nr:NAD-dependent dehydratase [Clostridiales bacterium]
MKVLFIGGTGNISSAVSELTVSKGFDLYLLNRGTQNSLAPKEATLIQCDIRDKSQAASVLKDYRFDIVVDWIAYEPEHIINDIELFKGKTKQFVFISSAACYERPPMNYLVNESCPLKNPYWGYAQKKIVCEDILVKEYRESGFPVTVVRPSYTYGDTLIPYVFNSRKSRWTLIDRMLKGKKVIVPGDGTSLFTVTHNTDFAKGITGLFGNVKAVGNAYHITSDEVLSWNQIIKIIADAVGVEPDLIHIPSDFLSIMSPENRGGLLGDKSVSIVFDNSKIKQAVPDFKALVPFTRGIKKTIAWFQSDPCRMVPDQAFDRLCDDIIDTYMLSVDKAVEYARKKYEK